MDAVAYQSHNILSFSMSFSSSKNCNLGKSSLHMKEIALQPSPFEFHKVVSPITDSRVRSDSGKSVQTGVTNENKRPPSFDGKKSKSSDQEEIIALFRRIQSSISKGESLETRKRSYKDKPNSTESLLDIFDKPQKQVKGRSKGTSVSRKEEEAPEMELKLSRVPSNFVKKSPIPYLSIPRGEVIELTNEVVPTIEGGKQVQSERLEKLKLGELKALAKSRRVKGYSKLKKDELVKMLRA